LKGSFEYRSREYEATYTLDDKAAGVQHGSLFPVSYSAVRVGSAAVLPNEQDGFIVSGSFVFDTNDTRPLPAPDDSSRPAGVLIAFDDNFTKSWEAYFPLFEKYGARVTFFITGSNTEFCRQAILAGHEAAFHTLTHPDLRKLGDADFFYETESALPHFEQAGIKMRSFAYPFGFQTDDTNARLLKNFKVLRGFGTTFRIYSEEKIRAGYISSKSLDNTIYKDDAQFYADTVLMLRTLVFLGRDNFFPVTSHDISDDAAWGIKPERLERLLATVKNLGLKFYRYCDFFED
jgi:peptidoglycan/xylan/chitin deacetylase (PgdA/CDA1 family)